MNENIKPKKQTTTTAQHTYNGILRQMSSFQQQGRQKPKTENQKGHLFFFVVPFVNLPNPNAQHELFIF